MKTREYETINHEKSQLLEMFSLYEVYFAVPKLKFITTLFPAPLANVMLWCY